MASLLAEKLDCEKLVDALKKLALLKKIVHKTVFPGRPGRR